jgi:cyclophilin family peptidyl-prolyl cis-trans isomerase
VFGRVERGQDVVEQMHRVSTDNYDKPRQLIRIKKCGMMKLKEKEPVLDTAVPTNPEESKDEKKEEVVQK